MFDRFVPLPPLLLLLLSLELSPPPSSSKRGRSSCAVYENSRYDGVQTSETSATTFTRRELFYERNNDRCHDEYIIHKQTSRQVVYYKYSTCSHALVTQCHDISFLY